MNQMDGSLPWSESGKQLLSVIEEIIRQNGGNEAMSEMIQDELTGTQYKRDRKVMKERIMLLHGKVKIEVLGNVLGLSDPTLYKLLHELDLVRPTNTIKSA